MAANAPVLLVSMPFAPLYAPSLGLSLLRGQLRLVGIAADVRYLGLDFAKWIGEEFYNQIAEGFPSNLSMAGEWLFSDALFPKSPAEVDEFVERVLRADHEQSVEPDELDVFIDRLLEVRSLAVEFSDYAARQIVDSGCQLIGFTSVFQQHVASLATARRLRALKPDLYIVMGGANCESPMGEEALRQFPFVDAVVSGEGELTFQRLALDFVESNDTSRPIPGVRRQTAALLALHSGAAKTPTASGRYTVDMDELPLPEYGDFIDQAQQVGIRADRIRLMIEFSRGCWWGEKHHCTFCGLNGNTMIFRSKSAARALEETKWLYHRFGIEKFSASDNILDYKYLDTFLPELAKEQLPIQLFFEVKANLKKHHLRTLRDAGVTSLQPGIESLSTSILSLMRKGITGLQNLQTLKWCKELGIDVAWNILWGFPGESPLEYESMNRLLPLIEHLPPPLGVRKIRMDRFSPNFVRSEEFGFVNVRAAKAYRHIYPFSDDVLNNLAYYFDYDFADEQLNRVDIEPLRRSVSRWMSAFDTCDLLAVDKETALAVVDLRRVATKQVSVLAGVERLLLLECDQIQSRAALTDIVTQQGFEGDPMALVSAALEKLIALKLVVTDGKAFLALPILVGEYSPKAAVVSKLLLLNDLPDLIESSIDLPEHRESCYRLTS